MLKGTVGAAIDAVRAAYPGIETRAVPDAQGGAWVEMLKVPLGPLYLQDASFFVFLLPFNLPGSDIYPFFVRPDLARLDGAPLGPAFQITQLSWPGESQPRAVVQISRRTRGSFALQTAPQKIAKVLDWLASQ
jgi:hypothetical protein